MPDTREKNRVFRQRMIQLRLALRPAEQREMNAAIANHLLEVWKKDWKKILVYINQPDEAETIPLIKQWISRGQTVCVPAYDVDRKNYFPSILKDFDSELDAGRFGILEPKEAAIRRHNVKEIDVIIVPGLAFDSGGNRLGYGYGFFDELCRESKAVKIGLGYQFQIVEQLDRHDKDVKLNFVITDRGVITCQKL